MMMFTTKMYQLAAIVLEHDVEEVTKELLKEGVLHFVKMSEVEGAPAYLHSVSPRVDQGTIGDTRRRIESFFNIIGYNPADVRNLDVSKLTPVDLDKCNSELDVIASSLHGIREKQKTIQQEIHKLEEIKRQLELVENLGKGFESKNKYSFLSMLTGRLEASQEQKFIENFQNIPSVHIRLGMESGFINILLITMKRDSGRVEKILNNFRWENIELSGNLSTLEDDAKTGIDQKISDLKASQEEAGSLAKTLVTDNRTRLDDMWCNLRMNELFYRIQSFYSKTARTMVFSGWLPVSRKDTLEKVIMKATNGKCYMEWSDPKDFKKDGKMLADVPVKMKNPKILSPFEMIVANYAIPEYGTIDPTPLVAAAYLVMFGLMFGDAGHGLVLALIGTLGVFLSGKDAQSSTGKIFQLMIWCGFSAIAAGILFGAYFGYGWFKPVWFDYHGIISGHSEGGGIVKDIYGILLITIYFGISVIGLGLLLNWINCISKRLWFKLFMDKGGLIGGWMYGAGIYSSFYFVGNDYKKMPPGNLMFLIIGLPAILLMLKPPLEMYFHNRNKRREEREVFTIFSLMNFFMEWLVEMLEIFSGYLANTLSFMRVAGLGIAHVSLMIAFDQISKMVSGNTPGFNIWAVLILIAGNALVIGLEGLSAGIQSLRLNYYEFFSKYFSGTGKAYAPITLRGNN